MPAAGADACAARPSSRHRRRCGSSSGQVHAPADIRGHELHGDRRSVLPTTRSEGDGAGRCGVQSENEQDGHADKRQAEHEPRLRSSVCHGVSTRTVPTPEGSPERRLPQRQTSTRSSRPRSPPIVAQQQYHSWRGSRRSGAASVSAGADGAGSGQPRLRAADWQLSTAMAHADALRALALARRGQSESATWWFELRVIAGGVSRSEFPFANPVSG